LDTLPVRDAACRDAMVFAYARNGFLVEASRFFAKFGSANTVLCNETMAAYSRAGLIENSLELFYCMPRRYLVPWDSALGGCCENYLLVLRPQRSEVSLTTMISVCSRGCKVEEAEYIFTSIPESRTSWLARPWLQQNGELEQAKKLFETISRPTSVSWIAMIAACAQHGPVSAGMPP
ncbi:hypothetical protein SELMODRAFT_116314, partial [Selaginella moellendorffii]